MRLVRIFVAGVLCGLVAEAAAGGGRRPPLDAQEALSGRPLGPSGGEPVLAGLAQVLEVSPDMDAFLDRWVERRAHPQLKLQQLVHAVIHSGGFELRYDETTRTAAGTFRDQRGNCLSFSSMFVAMARHVGLEASYQEVDVPPDWSMQDGTYVLNRHVNVLVDLGSRGQQVVDFNIDDFRTTYDRTAISDERAFAHYANNLGVEAMQAGDHHAALAWFRRALQVTRRRFSPAWTNLGTLYLRAGHPVYAESALLHALDADSGDTVAMSSLVRLYDASGDLESARELRRRVEAHRMRNPYYRFRLARTAFDARDYEAAVDHLRFAIRRKPREDEFVFLLGLCHLKLGDEDAARRWMGRAERLAASEALQRRYATKIDLLLGQGPYVEDP